MIPRRRSKVIPVMTSAFMLAAFAVFPPANQFFPLSVFAMLGRAGNIFFHELGHSLFGYLYGTPNLPSVMSLFSTDKALDAIFMFERQWLLQVIVIAGLLFLSYWLYAMVSKFFVPCLLVTILIIATSFTSYYLMVIDLMGHGTALAVAAYMLNLSLNDRSDLFKRWLCAFMGTFILLWHIWFCNKLISDDAVFAEYFSLKPTSIFHPDFARIEILFNISASILCVITIMISALLLAGVLLNAAWKKAKS